MFWFDIWIYKPIPIDCWWQSFKSWTFHNTKFGLPTFGSRFYGMVYIIFFLIIVMWKICKPDSNVSK